MSFRALLILTGLIFSTPFCFAQPDIKVDAPVQKFEKTLPGPVLNFNYNLTNNGNEPLIIDTIKIACTCTKFQFERKPIMPGETTQIKVTFDTAHKYGFQDRILEVYCNSPQSPIKLRFKGVVDAKPNK